MNANDGGDPYSKSPLSFTDTAVDSDNEQSPLIADDDSSSTRIHSSAEQSSVPQSCFQRIIQKVGRRRPLPSVVQSPAPKVSSPNIALTSDSKCILPGCLKAKYHDPANSRTHDFCGRDHTYKAIEQGIPGNTGNTVNIKIATDQEANPIVETFQQKWAAAKGPCPAVTSVYVITNTPLYQRWQKYRNGLQKKDVEQFYHGTKLTCNITVTSALCNDPACGVCGISIMGLDRRFICRNFQFQRFGHGFYLAPNSSKCHDYTQGSHSFRAMLVFDVCPGNKYALKSDNEKLKGPPQGFDSVHGQAGSRLNYDELVVYNPDAVLPKYIVVYQRKDPTPEQLYGQAIKEGVVSVKISNVLIFGMAGAGKTSTKNLICGLPPPEKRTSTPLANAPERIRNLSGTKVQATQNSWRPICVDELKQHTADLIFSWDKTLGPNASTEIATKLKQIDSMPNESSEETGPEVTPPTPDDEPLATADIDVPTATPVAPTSAPVDNPTTISQLTSVACVASEIKSLISASDDSRAREVFGSDWVHFIDSGGQPHFHNLLPHFIKNTPTVVFVLRLSDRLDSRPFIEYYKDDIPMGDAFRSHLSTADNFKYLVQSIQSRNKDCRLVCIGTHLDKSKKCREKIETKNRYLFELLPESIVENCHFNNVCEAEELLLCIDTQVLGDKRKETADTIREIIRKHPPREIKVPIWWYNLEIIIENISAKKNCKVLSFDQCNDVARALNFHKDALVEALKFFHHHHIFHYYPDILPNVLFSDIQVILDKVTELVEHAVYLRDAKKIASGDGKKFKIRDRGIITLDFLANFPKHYVEGLFGPAELIKVFKHLLIATSFVSGKAEYFVPSLLGISDEEELKSVRKALEKKSTPLFIQFKNGLPGYGVFCCLQVYLIKEHKWFLGKTSCNKPKQNVVKMFLPNSPQSVTLIDSITYIEIYLESKEASVCSKVRRSILCGIESACKALDYDNEEPELAFLCPHSTPQHCFGFFKTTKIACHLAVMITGSEYMRCTQDQDNTYPLEEKHKLWIANLDQGNASVLPNQPPEVYYSVLPNPPEVDYSQMDCSHAHTTMVTCSVSLNHALSQEPVALAAALLPPGLISQEVYDETAELNETKNEKGNRLYRTVLATIQNYPTRFAEFVKVLRGNKILYSDVLEEIDRTFEQQTGLT